MEPLNRLGTEGRAAAARVRVLREQRRMTVRDLSARLGEIGRPILPSGIVKLENSARQISVDDLVALAEALGVRTKELLDEPTAPIDAAFMEEHKDALRPLSQALRTAVQTGLSPAELTAYCEITAMVWAVHDWTETTNQAMGPEQ